MFSELPTDAWINFCIDFPTRSSPCHPQRCLIRNMSAKAHHYILPWLSTFLIHSTLFTVAIHVFGTLHGPMHVDSLHILYIDSTIILCRSRSLFTSYTIYYPIQRVDIQYISTGFCPNNLL